MATIALMVGGAITNALAFSGSNFIFIQISSAEERKRHSLAIEVFLLTARRASLCYPYQNMNFKRTL